MSSEAQGIELQIETGQEARQSEGAQPEDFINIALLKEIDQSGFIDKLDKKK